MQNRIKSFIERIFAKNYRLASLYYAVFSKAMSFEHFTVLNGKLKFKQDSSAVVLRRNTHRLEKGLIMVPRRDVFAKDYISETVVAYCLELKSINRDVDSLEWSKDVLCRYFDTVGSEPLVDKARKQYFQATDEAGGDYPKSPFIRGEKLAQTSYDELYDLSLLRRSVRWYEQKVVPRDYIDKAINLARLSPSACNRQPYKLKIYDSKEMVDKVASLPGGTKGFSHNFPMIIAITGQLRNYYSEGDRHIIYIDASLFSMSFVLALETLGLSSCIINWPENLAKEEEARTLLKLDSDERIIFFISVGFAAKDKLVPYSQKKSLDELRAYH